MGFTLVDFILQNMDELQPNQKLVLMAMATHINEKTWSPYCWPSYKRLAKITSFKPRSVQRITKQLQEHGHIHIASKGGGRHKANTYKISEKLISQAISKKHQQQKKSSQESMTLWHPFQDEKKPPSVIKNEGCIQNYDIQTETEILNTQKDDRMSPESIREQTKEYINDTVARNETSLPEKKAEQQTRSKKPPPSGWISLLETF